MMRMTRTSVMGIQRWGIRDEPSHGVHFGRPSSEVAMKYDDSVGME